MYVTKTHTHIHIHTYTHAVRILVHLCVIHTNTSYCVCIFTNKHVCLKRFIVIVCSYYTLLSVCLSKELHCFWLLGILTKLASFVAPVLQANKVNVLCPGQTTSVSPGQPTMLPALLFVMQIL